jgi:hypothetical protein
VGARAWAPRVAVLWVCAGRGGAVRRDTSGRVRVGRGRQRACRARCVLGCAARALVTHTHTHPRTRQH